MKLHYDRTAAFGLEHLLQLFAAKELPNLTRSTVPLLCYSRDFDAVAPDLLHRVLGLRPAAETSLYFEYAVPSSGGNPASQTDLVCLADGGAIGVEAKSTEPRYATVTEWLGKGRDPSNRQRVLHHWLALIRKRTGDIDLDVLPNVVNQMIHRFASICSLDRPRVALVYQVFRVRDDKARYLADLKLLAAATRAGGSSSIWLHKIDVRRTDQFGKVTAELQRVADPEEKALIVRGAVLGGRLFSFREASLIKVS